MALKLINIKICSIVSWNDHSRNDKSTNWWFWHQ